MSPSDKISCAESIIIRWPLRPEARFLLDKMYKYIDNFVRLLWFKGNPFTTQALWHYFSKLDYMCGFLKMNKQLNLSYHLTDRLPNGHGSFRVSTLLKKNTEQMLISKQHFVEDKFKCIKLSKSYIMKWNSFKSW